MFCFVYFYFEQECINFLYKYLLAKFSVYKRNCKYNVRFYFQPLQFFIMESVSASQLSVKVWNTSGGTEKNALGSCFLFSSLQIPIANYIYRIFETKELSKKLLLVAEFLTRDTSILNLTRKDTFLDEI